MHSTTPSTTDSHEPQRQLTPQPGMSESSTAGRWPAGESSDACADRVGCSAPEPFSRWLFSQRGGATHSELTHALAQLAQAVMDTGKAGELILKIRVSKASRSGGHQMFIADQITLKAPEAARDETLFFFDEDTFSLTRTDPRQDELPLQIVPRAIADRQLTDQSL